MCFFHLVKQHYRVRLAAHRFRQLTSFVISHIAGRRTDQSGHGVFFHILRHINTHHILLIIEQSLCQGFCQFRFTNAGRAEEQKRSNRAVGILNTGTASLDGLGNSLHRFFLTDHSLVQSFVKRQQLVALALYQPCHRDSRPPLHDPGNFLLRHPIPQHSGVLSLMGIAFFFLQCLFHLGQLSVFQTGRFFKIMVTFGAINLTPQLFHLLAQLLNAVNGILFIFPLGFQSVIAVPFLCQFLLQLHKACLGKPVILFFQRCFLNFHLDNFSGNRIQFRR